MDGGRRSDTPGQHPHLYTTLGCEIQEVAVAGKNRAGRRGLLTDEVHKRLVDAIGNGIPVEAATAYAGIHYRTFYLWLSKARDALETYAPDPDEPDIDDVMQTVPNESKRYVQLLHDVNRARAEATARNVLLVEKAAAGGYVIEETTRTHPDGTVEKTVRRQPPDWRAAAFWLERQNLKEFGKRNYTEITGAGGGPIQISNPDDVAKRVVASIERKRLELEASDDYVEAEVVSDTESD